MPERPAFQQYQFAFTAHIRDPKRAKRPAGVEARRMKIYNEIVYNNLESFLLACFPVTRKVLGRRRWDQLVRQFFAGHRCHTPYFRQIPDEFMQFLQGGWPGSDAYPAYLVELAHYEWIELVLSVSSRDEDLPTFRACGDLMAERPLLNPVLANLAYQYPVHRIRPRARIGRLTTFLLVFRQADFSIHFMEHTAVGARLLALLEAGELTGEEAVAKLASELNYPDRARLSEFAEGFLKELRQAGAILGTLN